MQKNKFAVIPDAAFNGKWVSFSIPGNLTGEIKLKDLSFINSAYAHTVLSAGII